jgi:peptide/nickel transport system permease protein
VSTQDRDLGHIPANQQPDESLLETDEHLGEDESFYVASQWKLTWWKFRKHKLSLYSGIVLGILYFFALFCEVLSPHTPLKRFPEYLNAPPTRIRFVAPEGGLTAPYIFGMQEGRDPETFRKVYTIDESARYPVRLFVQGDEYKFWGLIRTRFHIIGAEGAPLFLLGTDKLGRDLYSRILHGARISLSVGLVGIFFTFVLGLTLGGLSGYLGGTVDTIIQRIIDLLISLPQIPLWMALAAALPRDWPPLRIYFGIVIIFSIIGWTGLARVVRGKLLALREEDFVIAARVAGTSDLKIIFKHLIPNFASYIIVTLTLAIPNMILGETALSFLGLGLQPPVVSWGTLLQDAQNIQTIAHQPWLLTPCIFVIVAVLTFNFLGDGLRDSADPLKE